MEQLEKLYDCAERHLVDSFDWSAFSHAFSEAFAAEFSLYCTFGDGVNSGADGYKIYATSNTACVADFFENGFYQIRPMHEEDLPPLEPHRRTDYVSDEQVKELGPFYSFMQKHDVFYLMISPAIMPDGSLLSLVVWRGEKMRDFDDLEKQRLALFLRYIVALIRKQELVAPNIEARLVSFGKKHGLTATETEILGGLLAGQSLREFAASSNRTYATVRSHVKTILSKCHVNSQVGLLREFYSLIER